VSAVLRRSEAGDWAEIFALCAATGAAGEPVADEDRAAFAGHWIAPYRELRPDWTWAAISEGRVVGYLTGAPDTLAFEKERRRVFAPGPDSRDFFPHAARVALWAEHPAHLLVSVAAEHRGEGLGKSLVEAFFAELRRAGVPSAHVFCGPGARGFFERLSFRAAAEVAPAPGVVLSAMIRPV
jgi:GNAT superfamily N-acetyltransferase